MSRRIAPKTQALADQIVAVLRGADGFPLSTGQVARSLGRRFVSYRWHPPAPTDRPPCWPEGYVDEGLTGRSWCQECSEARGGSSVFHRPPVWRDYDANDVRGLLNRLAQSGEIERVDVDPRCLYWRREDTDG